MSADDWSECPRCVARGDVGLRANEFREDYEITGAETGTVTVQYRGECQRCGLLLEFTDHHVIPNVLEESKPNQPTGFILRKTWGEVLAGWFVRPPGAASVWWEVLAVDGDRFTLRNEQGQEGTWRRDLATDIPVRRGTNSKALDAAVDALNGAGITTQVIEDRTS